MCIIALGSCESVVASASIFIALCYQVITAVNIQVIVCAFVPRLIHILEMHQLKPEEPSFVAIILFWDNCSVVLWSLLTPAKLRKELNFRELFSIGSTYSNLQGRNRDDIPARGNYCSQTQLSTCLSAVYYIRPSRQPQTAVS